MSSYNEPNFIENSSLCQTLDSRQLTEKTRAEGAKKIERELRAPKEKGERSKPFARDARDSAKRQMIISKFPALNSCNAHSRRDKLKLFGL